MLDDFLQQWSNSSVKQKIALIKQVIIQTVMILIIAFVFFWCTLIFTWVLAMLIGVQPYYHASTPNMHVRTLIPSSLLTLYVNKDIKNEACQLGPEHIFFSQLTVPYHQYCNIDQQKLPRMKAPVDIVISQLDTTNTEYVTGCIKHRGREVSCQKYPINYRLQLFRNVEFQELYYLLIQLHMKPNSKNLDYMPLVQFQQQCWMITKLAKKYYSIFVIVSSYGITALLTICTIIFRIYKIMQSKYKSAQQSKPPKKLNSHHNSNTSMNKSKVDGVAHGQKRAQVPVSQKGINSKLSSTQNSKIVVKQQTAQKQQSMIKSTQISKNSEQKKTA